MGASLSTEAASFHTREVQGLMGCGHAECWRCGNGFETEISEGDQAGDIYCRVFIALRDIWGFFFPLFGIIFFSTFAHTGISCLGINTVPQQQGSWGWSKMVFVAHFIRRSTLGPWMCFFLVFHPFLGP